MPASPTVHTGEVAVIDAAGALGDAVMRESALQGRRVQALTSAPHELVVFSSAVTPVEISGDADRGRLADAASTSDAVVLCLGAALQDPPLAPAGGRPTDEAVTLALLRALRSAGEDGAAPRLVVSLPIEALGLRTDGRRAPSAPTRRTPLLERARAVRGAADRRAQLLDARRALELVLLSGADWTAIAHPPVLVAPGPAPTQLLPVSYAPQASAQVGAQACAARLLELADAPGSTGQQLVISEV
ncbi:hypothetical protein [Helcobacillus massiliensis]|uniref:NAD(P)H-binding protein n=1 Tax=Helcobacillus massiliensis TaxID=521392 RepID=A0A839QUM2_9MICO|nr:hypothetical protein [Helcobacillus massiliensis]MBB3023435.1 hypothetical protein [Helcobacillus massiliensis]